MGQCIESEAESIRQHREWATESMAFFSNKRKAERETWVVTSLLTHLGECFSPDQVVKGVEEPVDVTYGEARFQVKEILDEGRKRGDECKHALGKGKAAKSTADLIEGYIPSQGMSCDELACIIQKKTIELADRYDPSQRPCKDLLFYFNRKNRHVVGDVLSSGAEEAAKWRSVSVVANDCAFVLHASENAPGFLRKAVGKVYRNVKVDHDDFQVET